MARIDDITPEEQPDRLWSKVSYLINRISHRYNHGVQAKFREEGLTTLNARIIAALQIYEQLTVSELCVHAIAEQSTMSRALDRLEEGGLISRDSDVSDSRSRVMRLQPKGQQLFSVVMPTFDQANDDLLGALDPGEQAQLRLLLTKVLQNIRKNPV